MTIESRAAVKNSVILVMGGADSEIPQSMDGRVINSTSSCITVGTLPEVDGETSIILTDEKAVARSDPSLRAVFAGILFTARKEISVYTVLLKPLATLPVSTVQTRVEVWLDNEVEPRKVCFVVGE
jgi:hypothetical protein